MNNLAHFLEVENLKIGFKIKGRTVVAVDDVSFSVDKGETLCIVGESGSGKSVTSMAIMQLLAVPPAKYMGGTIYFDGENLLEKTEREMNAIRGKRIAMIFQEPMTALNPVLTIGYQMTETIRTHMGLHKKQAIQRAEELLQEVGINDVEKRMKQYPHELSGGMKQRVMIAMALSCNPQLLIADEPTTALDVTIQAQILGLLKKIKKDFGMTVVFITHDLGVVAGIADKVAVMYAGKIVETGEVHEIFANPRHPYTQGLISCIPKLDTNDTRLTTIQGMVPRLVDMPAGCRFSTRCPYADEKCRKQTPEYQTEGTHSYACYKV